MAPACPVGWRRQQGINKEQKETSQHTTSWYKCSTAQVNPPILLPGGAVRSAMKAATGLALIPYRAECIVNDLHQQGRRQWIHSPYCAPSRIPLSLLQHYLLSHLSEVHLYGHIELQQSRGTGPV